MSTDECGSSQSVLKLISWEREWIRNREVFLQTLRDSEGENARGNGKSILQEPKHEMK